MVGGSAITSYAQEIYTSLDIDFAVLTGESLRVLAAAMSELGFAKSGRVYSHPDTTFTVDFVADTPYVDQTPISDFAELRSSFGPVRVYHWSDSQSLDVEERVVAHLRNQLTWTGIDASLQKLDVINEQARERFNLARSRLQAALNG